MFSLTAAGIFGYVLGVLSTIGFLNLYYKVALSGLVDDLYKDCEKAKEKFKEEQNNNLTSV